MSANQHYEKISLLKQDLAYLYRQFVDASKAKIEQNLPNAGPLDPLQVEVENIINDYLAEAFEMAKLAFVVDGHDLGQEQTLFRDILLLKPSEEVLPLDLELNQKLRSIIHQVELETTEVTRLRRELPQQAKDAYEQLVSTADQEVTAIVKDLSKSKPKEEEEKEPEYSVEETIPNAAEITAELEESIRTLYGLKAALPAHQAQLKSLNDTIEFLQNNYERQQSEVRQRR